MLKFLLLICGAIGLSPFALSKEVHDTNLKLSCVADEKNFLSIGAKEVNPEEISIEIKKIDWNKDPARPPSWGSMSNIKIKTDGNAREASLLLSTKQHLAFSYVYNQNKEKELAFAVIYELDLNSLEIKKTSVALFNKNNNITTGVSYCKKLSS
jgi:hypothetical protein